MRSLPVVILDPGRDLDPRVGEAVEQRLVEQFVAHAAVIGRPRVLTDEQLQEARWRIEVGGKTTASVAREMDVPQWTLSRSLRRQVETVQ